jgi:hypothetical protein
MITAPALREILAYDPASGLLKWRVKMNRSIVVGRVAGSVSRKSGYRTVRLGRRGYSACRLAWLYVYGVWPTNVIDHKNGKRDDNRLSNLREVTHGENCFNRCRSKNNSSGFKGVSPARRRWRADISCNGVVHYLGRFNTPQSASDAYEAAASTLFGNHKRSPELY